MKVPDWLWKRIERLRQDSDFQKMRQMVEEDQKKIEALRKSMRDDLEQYAKAVSKFLSQLCSNEDGKKLFAIKDRLIIFCDTYWNGRPRPPSEASTTFATLEVCGNGEVYYCERYKWHPVNPTKLGFAPLDSEILITSLHPYYLKDLAFAIGSGMVWKYIENSIHNDPLP